MPRPRAILVVSAHWYIQATAVTAMPRPRTIHDFFGFPQELFDVRYDAPGLPELYDEVADIVHPTWVGADLDSWGIDHGAWSVLMHAFPEADIPVVQLSINALKPFDYHLQLGAALAPLREDGVLVVGSGNVVHNLGGVSRALPDAGFDWAQRFDEDAKELMLTDPTEVGRLDGHRDYDLAVPTPDHFLPLLVPRRARRASRARRAEVLVDGYAYGSLSMTSYTVGMTCPPSSGGGFAAARCPTARPRRRQHLSARASSGGEADDVADHPAPPAAGWPRRPASAAVPPASSGRCAAWASSRRTRPPPGVSGARPCSISAAAIAAAVSTPIRTTTVPRSRPSAAQSTSDCGCPGGRCPETTTNSCVEPAVGHRDADEPRHADRAGHAGHDLDRDARRDAGLELLHAAAEDERVAALEPRHPLAGQRVLDQQRVDLLLRHRPAARQLRGVDDLDVGRQRRQQRQRGEVVGDHDVGLRQRAQPAHGDQVRGRRGRRRPGRRRRAGRPPVRGRRGRRCCRR